MREIGVVTEIDGDYVIVTAKRVSACGRNCVNCGGCSAGKTSARVLNTAGAEKGDTVEVELDEKNVFKAAFLVYILPLLMFVAGYFISDIILKNNIFCVISAFIFMIIGFFLIRVYDGKTGGKYTPKAVSVVKKAKNESKNE